MSDDWPSAGTLLATRYRLVTLLETGGMAQIWHGRDELLGRPVAIKLPTGPQVAWREARMAAKLSHPNIAAVHDYREAVRSDGTVAPFVVMELLAGETVAARLERETFGWPEAARVGAAVADALAAAHASGVVHRDIKPGNVMITPTGIKILDFGISAAAGEPDDDDTGSTFGTPAYVAPERLDGMPAEPATDVYGLGVLLFEMVTGDPPYPVDTWEELDEARKSGPSTLPTTLPAAFREVVERCLDEQPAGRPGADEIRFDLTALWLADQPDADKNDESPTGAKATESATGAQTADSTSGAGMPAGAAKGQEGTSVAGGPRAGSKAGADRAAGAAGTQRAAGSAGTQRAPGSAGARRAAGAGRPAGSTAPTRVGGPRRTTPEGTDGASRPGGRPRSAFADPSRTRPQGGRPAPSYPPGRSAVSGRVAAATLPLTIPPRKRRLALLLSVLALLVAVGGAYAVINRPKERVDAVLPLSSSKPNTPLYTLIPPTAPSKAAPTTALPTPSPTPTETISYDDAVTRLRTAIQTATDSGQIRPDVATDLLNFVKPLTGAKANDVDAQIRALRNKVNGRASEGTLPPAQAAIIRARIADVERAAGM